MYLTSAVTTLLISLVPLCGAAIFDNPESLPSHKQYDYVVVGGAFFLIVNVSRTYAQPPYCRWSCW